MATAAYQLYQKLIAPIKEIANLDKNLTIIPDGILGYIPFEVLMKTRPKNNQLYGVLDYMIKEHQISYAYSARLLLEMQQKKAPTSDGIFLGIAPSFGEGIVNPKLIAQRSITNIRAGLSPLDFNISEVEDLQQLVGGKVLTGR